jgi:predicted phage terminase large subunit-like protein
MTPPRPDQRTLPKHTRLKKAMAHPDKVMAEECRRSLFFFMRTFWDQVSTDEPSWNWHIPYLCAQLMKEAHRVAAQTPREYDIIINIPPGTTKSMTCSIMFPVWCWINWHWMRFITSSYSGALSLELAEYSRDLVRSRKFKQLFPEIVIKPDKGTKSNYRIEKRVFDDQGREIMREIGGNRYSTSVGGTLTGFHGHMLIVDDPLNPTQAVSETELKSANHWIDNTLSTRKINKAVTPTILIMQRLHQGDPTGHIIDKKKGKVFHICLPGEIRNYKDKVSPPELVEHYQDGLLDPKRMPWNVLDDMEADLGQYGFAGQVGQNPTPPGGAMFKVDYFSYMEWLPSVKDDPLNEIVMVVRYWDKAGSQGKGAYTVGVKMGKLKSGKFIVLDVKRGQWSTDNRERIIKSTAQADGTQTIIYQEQEPGSGGKESAEATIFNLAGFSCYADRPTGDKVYRADPYSVQVNNGNVILLKGDWNHAFVEEHKYFPFGTYKDQVDASAGAFNKLRQTRDASVWSVNFA